MTDDLLEVRISVPREHAARLAETLVAERLAACVQAIPGVRSTYRWAGAVESAEETLLLVKTDRSAFPALVACVEGAHPYDVPEIVATPIAAVNPAYAVWWRDQLRLP